MLRWFAMWKYDALGILQSSSVDSDSTVWKMSEHPTPMHKHDAKVIGTVCGILHTCTHFRVVPDSDASVVIGDYSCVVFSRSAYLGPLVASRGNSVSSRPATLISRRCEWQSTHKMVIRT